MDIKRGKSTGSGKGKERRVDIVDEDDDDLVLSSRVKSNTIAEKPFRSPTLNINICLPKSMFETATRDTDSSPESSSDDNYLKNMTFKISGENENSKNGEGRIQNSLDQKSEPSHSFGHHKKRIITPPHKLRSNLLRNKKLRLEKGKTSKSPSQKFACGSRDYSLGKICKSFNDKPSKSQSDEEDDERLRNFSPELFNFLPEPYKSAIAKKSEKNKLKQHNKERDRNVYRDPLYSESDNEPDNFDIEKWLRKDKVKTGKNVNPKAIASASSGVLRSKDEDQDGVAKAKSPAWLDLSSSSDDETTLENNSLNHPKTKLYNEDSSDSELEYSWIGPSPPPSRPKISSYSCKFNPNSLAPKPSCSYKKLPVPPKNTKSLVFNSFDQALNSAPSTSQSQKSEKNVPKLEPKQRNDLFLNKPNAMDSTGSTRRKGSRETFFRPSIRHSSDADTSSSAHSSSCERNRVRSPVEQSSALSCRPKCFCVDSSSDSEASPVPPTLHASTINNLDVAPASPGMTEALRQIEQIEADEAFARMLQFELNQDLFPTDGAPAEPTDLAVPVAADFGHQMAPTTSSGSVGNARPAHMFPKRNIHSRTASGRYNFFNAAPTMPSPPPPLRSPQSRIPRGRTRRYHSPMSLLESNVFNEPFAEIDDQLRIFITSLESEEVQHPLYSRNPNRRTPRLTTSGDDLDSVIRAVVTDNEVGHRPAIRNRTMHRRRSPRGQRHPRFYGLGAIMNEGTDYEDLLAIEDRVGLVPVGLSRNQINRLPIKKYDNGDKCRKRDERNDEENCHICLCDYDQGESLRILPCFHEFHSSCIDQWLQVKDTCPVCRMRAQVD